MAIKCVFLLLIFAFTTTATTKDIVIRQPGNQDWWKNAVFYQIYPRSFKDDDNDGTGDLIGITNKLVHLHDAGVTAAWLSPIYESPQVDQGYDISNFTNIDPTYGTFDDFNNLVEKARSLGIKIIMDFVPNHSSNEHPWFTKSETKEEGFEDYYIWKDGVGENNASPPNNWISIFKYSAWNYSDVRKQFYLHQFAAEQPDLNYQNPKVVEEMKNVLRFWLDKGVDGFRMDAVPYLFEDEKFEDEPLSNLTTNPDDYEYLEHIYTKDLPGTFDMIYVWREYIDNYTSEKGGDARIMMTESYTDINNTMKYYGNGTKDGAHFTFNFQLITKLNGSSNAKNIVEAVQEWMDNVPENCVSNWVLGNHDNHRVATRFGPEKVDGYNILGGLLPGVFVTYNGEEIGQEDGEVTWEEGQDPSACIGKPEDFNKTSRDFERTPFHWDKSTNAGFNNGTEPWLPVSKKYLETNLERQSNESVLSHYQVYKQLVQLRKQPAFQHGNLTITALTDNVVGFNRVADDDIAYVVLFNVGGKEEKVNATDLIGSSIKVVLLSSNSARQIGEVLSTQEIILSPHEALVGANNSVASIAISTLLIIFLQIIMNTLQTKEEETKKLQEEIRCLRKEQREFKDEIKEIEMEQQNSNKETKKLQEEIRCLRKEQREFKDEIKEIEMEQQNSNKETKKLQEEIRCLRKEQREFKDEIKEIKESNGKTKKEIKDLKKEVTTEQMREWKK
ncbi:hypothetical protein FQA39_LY02019 [Lamprigera yunnana]|nr:hypothetical protein FQA39_LY02019 [Lamprigera yunnana]